MIEIFSVQRLVSAANWNCRGNCMTIVGSKANNVQNKNGSLTCIAHFIYVSSSCVFIHNNTPNVPLERTSHLKPRSSPGSEKYWGYWPLTVQSPGICPIFCVKSQVKVPFSQGTIFYIQIVKSSADMDFSNPQFYWNMWTKRRTFPVWSWSLLSVMPWPKGGI